MRPARLQGVALLAALPVSAVATQSAAASAKHLDLVSAYELVPVTLGTEITAHSVTPLTLETSLGTVPRRQ